MGSRLFPDRDDLGMEGGSKMMVITIAVLGICMLLYGLYFGYQLGKTSRKIVLPEWVQMVRDTLGF